MKTALGSIVLSMLATSAAWAEPVAPLEPTAAVTVGTFAYSMHGYLSSTPAILTGIDAAYDHDLTSIWGLRFRGGAVLLAIDEITGWAPHGEAGVFRLWRLAPGVALDGSLLAGYYGGGLDHKEAWKDHGGPTAMAEVALRVSLAEIMLFSVGGGYRLAWTADEHLSGAGSTTDPFSSGPLVRFNLGWSF